MEQGFRSQDRSYRYSLAGCSGLMHETGKSRIIGEELDFGPETPGDKAGSRVV